MRAYNLAYFFFCIFCAFWPYLKKYLITLKSQFSTPNYIFMLHMTKILCEFIISTRKTYMCKIGPQTRFLQLGSLRKMRSLDFGTVFKN